MRELCTSWKLTFEEVQKWHEGYVLGRDVHIYSSKSVMEAIQRKRIGNYWTQSETYESLKLSIEMDEDGLKEAIVQMLGGSTRTNLEKLLVGSPVLPTPHMIGILILG